MIALRIIATIAPPYLSLGKTIRGRRKHPDRQRSSCTPASVHSRAKRRPPTPHTPASNLSCAQPACHACVPHSNHSVTQHNMSSQVLPRLTRTCTFAVTIQARPPIRKKPCSTRHSTPPTFLRRPCPPSLTNATARLALCCSVERLSTNFTNRTPCIGPTTSPCRESFPRATPTSTGILGRARVRRLPLVPEPHFAWIETIPLYRIGEQHHPSGLPPGTCGRGNLTLHLITLC